MLRYYEYHPRLYYVVTVAGMPLTLGVPLAILSALAMLLFG